MSLYFTVRLYLKASGMVYDQAAQYPFYPTKAAGTLRARQPSWG